MMLLARPKRLWSQLTPHVSVGSLILGGGRSWHCSLPAWILWRGGRSQSAGAPPSQAVSLSNCFECAFSRPTGKRAVQSPAKTSWMSSSSKGCELPRLANLDLQLHGGSGGKPRVHLDELQKPGLPEMSLTPGPSSCEAGANPKLRSLEEQTSEEL